MLLNYKTEAEGNSSNLDQGKMNLVLWADLKSCHFHLTLTGGNDTGCRLLNSPNIYL